MKHPHDMSSMTRCFDVDCGLDVLASKWLTPGYPLQHCWYWGPVILHGGAVLGTVGGLSTRCQE